MQSLLLIFLGLFFGLTCWFIGSKFISDKFRVWSVIILMAFSVATIWYIDVTFPLSESTFGPGGIKAPAWIVCLGLAGRFIVLAAIASCGRSETKNDS